MSEIAGRMAIAGISDIKLLSGVTPQKISPEDAARFEEIWKMQFRIPQDVPEDAVYATVKVNGKVVATLHNSGCSVTSNADHGRLSRLPSMGEGETLTGPALAQKRAEEIARALGGTIEKASTAKTASQWQPPVVKWTYDYAAMEAAREPKSDG